MKQDTASPMVVRRWRWHIIVDVFRMWNWVLHMADIERRLRNSDRTRTWVLIAALAYFVTCSAKDVAKRMRLSHRSMHQLRANDVLVTFVPPNEAVLTRFQAAHGFRPNVVCPENLLGEHGGDLVLATKTCETALKTLRALGGPDAVLHPLIQRMSLLGLAKKTGLTLPRTRRRLLKRDNVLHCFNNKQWQQMWAARLGIPFPASVWCTGKEAILAQAATSLQHYAELRLRLGISAGGLGVCALKRGSLINTEPETLATALPPDIDWNGSWGRVPVAVEPFVDDIEVFFSIVCKVTSLGPVIIEDCDRIVVDGSESAGGAVPSRNVSQETLAAAKRMTLRMAWVLYFLGYRGNMDGDFGQRKNIVLPVWFEWNVRDPATLIQIDLRDRYVPDGCAIGRDYLFVGEETTYEDVADFLKAAPLLGATHNLLWQAGQERNWGVFVTLEPEGGAMAYTVVAPNHELCAEVDRVICNWAAQRVLRGQMKVVGRD